MEFPYHLSTCYGFAGCGAAAAASAPAEAGLVSSKTSPNTLRLINLDRGACADRRLKRMKRNVWASGRLHEIARPGFRSDVPWFVTLTYRDADAWCPDHISSASDRFRRWCLKCGVECRYVWVAEIQTRRARETGKHVVHYHLIAWLPHGVRMPKWDVECGRRLEFWPHGMTNTQPAKAGVGYLMKYLSKLGEFTQFPPGLRLHGAGGLNAVGRRIRCWLNLPEWAKCTFGVGDLVRKSGRLMVQATGEILVSPYVVHRVPGALVLQTVGVVPERFHCGPYSTFPPAAART